MKTTINTKALQGQMTIDYKVKTRLKGAIYIVDLHIESVQQQICIDSVIEVLESHPTTEDAIKAALDRASKKWGIQLTKEQLKAA